MEKGEPGNFVTAADLASEKFIIGTIFKKFPSHTIMSEETRSRISDPQAVANLWIVDPLDGTANFHYGVPFFAVSVAYAEFGTILAGAVYDPMRKEIFFASRGQGAYLGRQRLKVGDKKEISGTLVNAGSPYKIAPARKIYPAGKKLLEEGARIRNFGASALEAAYVAAGRLSVYYDLGPMPWDVAASSLIVAEAGGTIEFVGGGSVFDAKGFVFAASPDLARQTAKMIRG